MPWKQGRWINYETTSLHTVSPFLKGSHAILIRPHPKLSGDKFIR
jgi:hypothetical protein